MTRLTMALVGVIFLRWIARWNDHDVITTIHAGKPWQNLVKPGKIVKGKGFQQRDWLTKVLGFYVSMADCKLFHPYFL